MTRQRLRPAHSPEALAEIYAQPHSHSRWRDHKVRVGVTQQLALGLTLGDDSITTVGDLSCGDAAVVRSLGDVTTHLGDFAPGYHYTGPLEQTLDQMPKVDLYVCSETLEHLDDPDLVLGKLREKTRWLLLTTPIDAWNETNVEHYWAWSRSDVESMFDTAGFNPRIFNSLDMRGGWSPYNFGMWVCD